MTSPVDTASCFPDLRRLAGGVAIAALVGLAPCPALAEGGCPWQQDVTVDLGGKKTLTLPQAVFDPKSEQQSVDGYELLPNVNQLLLRIAGPYGDIWEAALTRLAGKRCVAYYVGKPVLVEQLPPPDRALRRKVAQH